MEKAPAIEDLSATGDKSAANVDVNVGSIEAPNSNKESQFPPLSQAIIVVLAIYLAAFLVALDQTIIGVAIPKITDQFKSIPDIAWYGSAYSLTSTALQASFLAAVGIFEIGSLICGVAPSSIVLIVGRAIAGIEVAGIFSGALFIISMTVPLPKRPLVFGIYGVVWGVSSIIGPLLGGAFTDGGISMVVVLFFIRLPSNNQVTTLARIAQELDLIGASLIIPAVICLILALRWGGNSYAWGSSQIIGLFVRVSLLILLFTASQVWITRKDE
ncbi:Efflux pump roqT [Penicillium malachiteum]|nr:Efflux pump roqT [Penicillium malachiteum]